MRRLIDEDPANGLLKYQVLPMPQAVVESSRVIHNPSSALASLPLLSDEERRWLREAVWRVYEGASMGEAVLTSHPRASPGRGEGRRYYPSGSS